MRQLSRQLGVTEGAVRYRPKRLHGDIKRRIKAAGAFPDRASVLRLVTAVALWTTAVWEARRYLDLTLLKTQKVA